MSEWTGPELLPVREQARIVNDILGKRFETLLPQIMREADIDAWLIVCNEDNHDPVFRTMIPWQSWTPILQIFLFLDPGGDQPLERLNLSMTNDRGLMTKVDWSPESPEDQWTILRRLLDDRNPDKVAINTSETIWAADGLTASLKDRLTDTLGPDHSSRLVSAEQLCIRWLETRLPDELVHYEDACAIARHMIAQCYSRDTITPGITTTEDLLWAYWQQASDLGLIPSFTPSFRIFRSPTDAATNTVEDGIIRPGDMLHCDVGVHYLRLTTDHQELAYVLREGETEAPAGLRAGIKESNRLQDIFTSTWEFGKSGNEILAAALSKAHETGISNPKIYSHSLGHYLHEPGPLMGLPWEQDDIPGRGDVIMHPDTVYVVELSTELDVPEWSSSVRFMLEQDTAITTDGVSYLAGRQTNFHLI
ncbi:MAG: Xaa-Pro aminopeptidase [Gemmatimonadetes bacterium]|nr:Xaa-Pro aminopeptidase [Gemmatimonadota bacterium]